MAGFALLAAGGLCAVLASAMAQDRPPAAAGGGGDPALVLFALRLSPPDPMTASPEAGLDAARAELAAGLVLSERLAQGRTAGVALTVPAPGPVLETFGQRQVGGLRAQGLTLRTTPGAEVRAPSAGDVLYAGALEGFGEAVILQATPRAQVVLAGDFTTRVREGDTVTEGQVLGRVSDRGAGASLYLELRDLGRPIDPAPWLRPEKATTQGSGFSRETG
jgi:murein DD-endopeptidase MepM/ murein hydrolase activator NlpD